MVQLNFAALSNETPFNRDTVESCVKEVLQALSRSVQAKRNVEFHFAGIGRLSIRESKVKMKFYKEFLRSMDGSGSLVHALSNVSLLFQSMEPTRSNLHSCIPSNAVTDLGRDPEYSLTLLKIVRFKGPKFPPPPQA